MGRLLVALLVIAVAVGGLGYYLGWFEFSKAGDDHKTNITIGVDQDKIKEDAEKAKEKVKEIGHGAKEKVSTSNGEKKD